MGDNLIESLKKSINPILGVRDTLGAQKHDVFLLTRTWSGEIVGDGQPVDTKSQVLPSPNIVDLSHSLRLKSGGNIRQGDILLKMISKQSFPERFEIDGEVLDKNVEFFYFFGDVIYRVISVTEDHLWWNVQVRAINDSETFF